MSCVSPLRGLFVTKAQQPEYHAQHVEIAEPTVLESLNVSIIGVAVRIELLFYLFPKRLAFLVTSSLTVFRSIKPRVKKIEVLSIAE